MAKSPKKEQGNGKKFQNRLPGEKRNRKVDVDKPEPKKTKFYTDSKPGASSVDKPRFGGDNRGGDRGDKPRFGADKPSFGARDRGTERPKFGGSDRGTDRPKFGGDNKFGDRGDKPRFGADSIGGDRLKFGNAPRSFPDKNRAPFGGNPRGSFKNQVKDLPVETAMAIQDLQVIEAIDQNLVCQKRPCTKKGRPTEFSKRRGV